MSITERLDNELREITGPLMHHLKEVEREIERGEETLRELRSLRTRLVGIARQIDPELVPKKETKSKSTVVVSDTVIGQVWDFVQSKNGEEFYASGLLQEGITVSQSQVSKALTALHEQGRITLTRKGSGGSKYFKVIA